MKLMYNITQNEFNTIAKYVYEQVGIHLPPHKIHLVRGRLSKRLRFLQLDTFSEYFDYLVNDETGEELLMLTNEISTNVTSFFREPSQWSFLENEVKLLEQSSSEKKLRVWSAACSSGQEPYTIAIFLVSMLKDPKNWDIKILATDISEEIILKATKGLYSEEDVKGLPKNMLMRYFNKEHIYIHREKVTLYRIDDKIKKMVTFKKFNLVHGNYDIVKPQTFNWIFCRNVMIYFDKETKQKVVLNLVNKTKKQGFLLIGHSESLVTMNNSSIKLAAPSIYKIQ